ncbi:MULTISPECIES: nuclear transport factor 2 family protein [Lysinibacillus]|uniref:Nuclear transport factor 2 family protein n=1 Tax=Lysinibacillus antri TaxID=2498145 RepID=A0A3S0R7D8_9BACI|nr:MULTISPECIES: nuclear transport factor 2 family protein [Lysinibacillus]RUL54710.1 nuclear transport factor 2 family protein [Lysinibacillus antri]TSI11006.1 nuclear transport factor 2 family protein [Lysinibacillus sp. BW-2-10]
MLLQDYVACLNKGDFEGLSNLFTEDCRFNDGAARTINVNDLVVDGREAIKSAFQSVFASNKIRAEVVKLNANSMEYDVFLGDVKLECIGCATLKNGLIDEYIVRPR